MDPLVVGQIVDADERLPRLAPFNLNVIVRTVDEAIGRRCARRGMESEESAGGEGQRERQRESP